MKTFVGRMMNGSGEIAMKGEAAARDNPEELFAIREMRIARDNPEH